MIYITSLCHVVMLGLLLSLLVLLNMVIHDPKFAWLASICGHGLLSTCHMSEFGPSSVAPASLQSKPAL